LKFIFRANWRGLWFRIGAKSSVWLEQTSKTVKLQLIPYSSPDIEKLHTRLSNVSAMFSYIFSKELKCYIFSYFIGDIERGGLFIEEYKNDR